MTMFTAANKLPVAIIGAGNMGSGIAQKYATHGYDVIVVDQNHENLKKGQHSIDTMLKQGVLRNVFAESDAVNIYKNMKFTTELNNCKDALLIIEAIFEDLPLKQELFISLEGICQKTAIIATNTSSLMVSDIVKNIKRPERVVGLHYFYPPAKNRLVELIGTDKTSPEVLEHAKAIQHSIKKIVVESKDSPGFIVNRFFVPWLNEALHIVYEGKANAATVEHAAKAFFNIGMGPFELMNVTGLPITFHACTALKRAMGNFYGPCPLLEQQLEKRMPFDLLGPVDGEKFDEIGLRLLSVVASISCKMVLEEGVCSIDDADLGARVGLLWERGPFELINSNLATILSHLPRYQLHNRGLSTPQVLLEHLKNQQPIGHT